MSTKRRNKRTTHAHVAGFNHLHNDRLVRQLVGKIKVARQRRVPGLRRMAKSITLHPVLMTEWLCAAAAEGKSPALLMAEMLAERWFYRAEDV